MLEMNFTIESRLITASSPSPASPTIQAGSQRENQECSRSTAAALSSGSAAAVSPESTLAAGSQVVVVDGSVIVGSVPPVASRPDEVSLPTYPWGLS